MILLTAKLLLFKFVFIQLFCISYLSIVYLQTWLFGYEMHDVLVVFCQDSVVIFAGAKKINYLKQVNLFDDILIGINCCFQIESEQNNKENAPRNFNFLIRKDNDEKNFLEIIEQIKQSHQGQTLGVFSKDKMEGAFGEQWQNCLDQHSFTTVRIILLQEKK